LPFVVVAVNIEVTGLASSSFGVVILFVALAVDAIFAWMTIGLSSFIVVIAELNIGE